MNPNYPSTANTQTHHQCVKKGGGILYIFIVDPPRPVSDARRLVAGGSMFVGRRQDVEYLVYNKLVFEIARRV